MAPKVIFKITCFLWVNEEITFLFPSVFSFLFSPSPSFRVSHKWLPPPPSCDFLTPLPPSKFMVSPLWPSHLKMKPFQEIICRKSSEKLEIVINTCVSLIKQYWKKMVEIPQKRDFLSCGILNFVKKDKQFARKYITWLTELANKLYDIEKSWFHCMPCVIKNCLVLLRNLVNKPFE